MGTWGVEPWDNDEAADWFSEVFKGIDIDTKIEKALCYDYDNYDQVRAAAYLLQVLGVSYVWPGDLNRLSGHVQRALELLKAMIDPDSDDKDMDFLALWDNDPEVIEAVRKQIEQLEQRLLP
jgi:hypothetical protein